MKIFYFSLASLVFIPAKCMPGTHMKRDEIQVQEKMSPCAQVSASASASLQIAPKASPIVKAQLAYECLTSVPLNKIDASELVNSIFPYIEWQSDLSYLKNPPKGYLMPAVDIKAELNRILLGIKNEKYANEHEFQMDLFQVFQSVHDGHFRFIPDLLGKTLQFLRPVGIVSVSKDGIEVPKVYVDTDIKEYGNGSSLTMPSPIIEINHQNATSFITEMMIRANQHDPDAQYNMMMYGKAYDARYPNFRYRGLFSLAGRLAYFYPGPNTTIRFENGTEKVYQNHASVIGKFDGVTDGLSMYKKFCSGSSKTLSQEPAKINSTPAPTYTPDELPPTLPKDPKPVNGYPTPHVISLDQLISGYFLDDPDHQDVAVLVIFSFQAGSVLQFQSVVQNLIADSLSMGKKKIIIDLSSNSGGNLLCGYDTFRQFFPKIEQSGFSRFRSHDALKIITSQISQRASNFSINSTDSRDYDYYQTPFNYRFDLNETNGRFLTYDDKFKPRIFNNDEYTSNMRWDLEDPTMTSPRWGNGMTITGYGNRKDFLQPFKPEDIVLLHDGVCASTCAIFSEFMQIEAGVRSVAIGGRPNKDPIQGIGGTKGANSYSFASIRKVAGEALETGTPEQIANWTSLTALTDLPIKRSTDSAINIRDNILRANLVDGIPAQFIYEPADCRLYYEPQMITDVRAVWKKVASVVWGNSPCVAGTMKPQLNIVGNDVKLMEATKPKPNQESFSTTIDDMEPSEESQKLITETFGTTVPI